MTDRYSELVRKTAADSLGLPPDPFPESARAVLFDRLSKSEFFPDQLLRESAACLGAMGNHGGPRPMLHQTLEEACARRVEEFAEAYWTYSVNDRRTQWETLMQDCDRFPRLLGRLVSLESGLEIVPETEFTDATEAGLSEVIVEFYPLKPAIRAGRMRLRLKELGTSNQIRVAAKTLSDISPVLRQIDRGLLKTLRSGRQSAPLLRTRSEIRPSGETIEYRYEKKNTRNWYWLIVPICGVILAMIRAGSGGFSSNNSSSYSDYRTTSDSNAVDRSKLNASIARLLAEKREAKMGKESPAVKRLTSGQIDILCRLATQRSVAGDELARLSSQFRQMGFTQPPAENPASGETEWTRRQRELLNDAQREVLVRLRQNDLTEVAIRSLLREFVQAGILNAPQSGPKAGGKP